MNLNRSRMQHWINTIFCFYFNSQLSVRTRRSRTINCIKIDEEILIIVSLIQKQYCYSQAVGHVRIASFVRKFQPHLSETLLCPPKRYSDFIFFYVRKFNRNNIKIVRGPIYRSIYHIKLFSTGFSVGRVVGFPDGRCRRFMSPIYGT